MFKKITSIILCLSLVLSLSNPVMATDSNNAKSASFRTSSTGYMEINVDYPMKNRSNLQNEVSFEIKQFENNELTQIVRGESNGDKLIVSDYQNGNIIKQETIFITDKVMKNTIPSKNIDDKYVQPYMMRKGSVGKKIGIIKYNTNPYTKTQEKL